MSYQTVFALLIPWIVLIAPARAAESLAELLEKAIYTENTAGNLDEAISLYEKIIATADANRVTVAQAHLRRGLCLAKKGSKAEATEAFKLVKAKFSDQKDVVAAANRELAKLGGADSKAATTQPGAGRGLLDEPTRAGWEKFENMFASRFQKEQEYEAASASQRTAMIEQWMADAKGSDFEKRTRAIAALGNVRAKQAMRLLMGVAQEPMRNNRPKWMAVRGLGQIGDPTAVPVLIDLVDHGNQNVQVYARWALAELTGVYFAEDKAKWRKWWSERAAKAPPADKREAEALSLKGWQLLQQGKMEEAEKAFNLAVAKDPQNAKLLNGLGWSQFNGGKPLAAKQSFEQAVQSDPKAAASWNGLGWIAKNEGKTDEAIEHWKKAVEAMPTGGAALRGLALTYMEMEKPKDALKYYEMWLKAEPGNAEAKAGVEKARATAGSGGQ